MPDPAVYAWALTLSAFVSAVVLVVAKLTIRSRSQAAGVTVGVVAVTASMLAGYWAMKVNLSWPPVTGLSRFLTILLPATIVVELAAGFVGIQSKTAWRLRAAMCSILSPIILQGSVYLNGAATDGAWTASTITVAFAIGFGLSLAGLLSMQRLTERSVPTSVSFSLAMAIFSAGIATMLGGYINGGAAAFPIAAALAASAIIVTILSGELSSSGRGIVHGTVGIGSVSLFCLLCIARFFGNVSSVSALMILLAPHLCWLSEHPKFKPQTRWKITLFRLVGVAIPLGVVLLFAAIEFNLKMAPLLVVSWRES